MRDFTIALLCILAGLLSTILLPVRWGGVWCLAVFTLPWVVFTGWRALLGWIALGVILGLVSQSIALAARPAIEPAEAIMITGKVAGLPETFPNRQRFVFQVDSMDAAALSQPIRPHRIRVSIYGSGLRVKAGEHWRLPLKIRRPRGFMNPLRFDYEAWLAASGMDATAYVVDAEQAQRLRSAGGIARWRAEISAKVARSSAEQAQGSALLQGLVTGDRRAFSDTTWEILRLTGTSHLLAISGLHIGLAASLGYFLGRWAWRWLRLPGNRQLWAVMSAAFLATGYAALAGFSLPTQRALLMFLLFALASLLTRQRLGMNALLLAAVVLLVIDPAAALGASFWLSFTAVLLILLAAHAIQRAGAFWGLVKLQCLLTLGLAPLTAIFFGQWSPLGLIVNLGVLPLFAFFIVPAALIAVMLSFLWSQAGAALLEGLSLGLQWLLEGGEYLLRYGLQPMPTGVLTPLILLAAVAAITLMLLPRGAPLRLLVLPLLLPLLAGHVFAGDTQPALPRGTAKMTWLEVGQGNAAVIQTQTQVTVVDTGPAWGAEANAAAFTLVPFLEEQGIQHIDRLLVTHADRDHRGGVETLAENFSLGEVWVGESIPDLPRQQLCHTGAGWVSDGVAFDFLWPLVPGQATGNAASCVLRLTIGDAQVVLTGDVDRAIEKQLVRRFDMQVDILEAPHHGSQTATSERVLQAWRPEWVVISAGYRNPYGMPHREVLQRIHCHGADWHDLGLQGALQITLSSQGVIDLKRFRNQRARLLHEPRQQPRFREGREIHYHQRFIATSPTEAGQPKCGN